MNWNRNTARAQKINRKLSWWINNFANSPILSGKPAGNGGINKREIAIQVPSECDTGIIPTSWDKCKKKRGKRKIRQGRLRKKRQSEPRKSNRRERVGKNIANMECQCGKVGFPAEETGVNFKKCKLEANHSGCILFYVKTENWPPNYFHPTAAFITNSLFP